ncbi:MAG: radical SAM protein, partial [Candidatus Cloacimonadota bacterium]
MRLKQKINYWNSALRLDLFRKRFELAGLSSGRVPPPSYVLWDCTRRCNLNCLHCGASKEHYDTELSTAQVKALIDQLAKLKVRTFAVTGGEPLLRQDLVELLSYASVLGI